MSGFAPLTYDTIEKWTRVMDIGELSPLEVEALMILDAVLITTTDKQTQKEAEEKKAEASWPKRKKP